MKKKVHVVFLILIGIQLSFVIQAQTFSSGNLAISIPDDKTPLIIPLPVSGLPSKIDTIYGLESVCINITHSMTSHVIVYLIGPNGIGTEITSNNGYMGANYTNTCFKMDASQFIVNAAAPFTGTYRPEGDLSMINNGQDPNAAWKLYIVDDVPSYTGSVDSWSITFSDNPAKPFRFMSSNLPIVMINTHGKTIADEPKIMVDMGIIYNGPNKRNSISDPWNHYSGKAGIEFHGSSSQLNPKKSYGIETWSDFEKKFDASLLGMPTEHDWVLQGPYADKTLIRNVFSYKLFRDMGHYSPRTEIVELVINDQYQGVYVLTEKIKRDPKRVDVSKLTLEDVAGDDLSGGYIIKIDRVNGSGGLGWHSKFNSNSTGDSAVFFQYEYPKPDSMVQVQKDYIRNYIDDFENVLTGPNFSDPGHGYRKYISITSFIDYLILTELSKNTDGYRLSTFLHKDKDSEGGKLKIGPVWDFDIAWYNANFGGGNELYGWQYEFPAGSYFIPFWWKRFMEDSSFVNDLNCRYKHLRHAVLNVTYINRVIDSLTTYVNEGQQRNFQQYPILGVYVWPNPTPILSSYEAEVTRLREWISGRIAWMDANIPGKCTKKDNPDPGKGSLVFFPNPFNHKLQVRYQVFNAAEVKLELVNTIGVIVHQSVNHYKLEGVYEEEIAAGPLPAGPYVLRLTINSATYHEKLVKMN